nr:multidrug and toxin extrusion protein 2-like [Kogia breviceps]
MLLGIIVPQAVTGIAANARNVGTNALLRCALDFGVAGSAWANTTSQSFLSAFLFLYVWWKKIHVNTWGGWSRDCLQEWGSFVQLAVPSVVMVCIEWWTSEARTFLAGGVTELGARAVICVLASVAYTPAGDSRYTNCECWVTDSLFFSNRDIVALVSQVTPIFAPFHLFDALAGTSGGVLRGAGKRKTGAFLDAIGYYVFGFPLGASLMFAANHGVIGLWSGLTLCVFFQTLFYLVSIWRMSWTRAAEQAQVRAGLRGTKEAVPTAMDLSILEKGAADGVILPDVIRPESQSTQLVAENSSGVATTREVLTGTQLLLYRGLAVVLAFAVLVAGILIRVFTDRG